MNLKGAAIYMRAYRVKPIFHVEKWKGKGCKWKNPLSEPQFLHLSIQFSCSVVSDSLRPNGLWHARLLCTSPTPRAYSNWCPSSQWCHPTISSSVVPFSSFNLSQHQGLFLMSEFFTSGGQRAGVSVSASVLPMNIQNWFPIVLTGLISLQSRGLSKSLPQQHSSKASILRCSAFFIVQFSHPYMTTGKTIALTRWTFVGKVMSLLFNMLSMLVIAFLPRSTHLLLSWLHSPSAVILEPRKIKVSRCFHCFPIDLPWSDGTGFHDFCFLNAEL